MASETAINGLLGGCAGTNYGENNSLMAITRNYSGPVLIAAGVIAMLLGFVGKLAAVVETLPMAVTGGLAIFLFGIIGLQGVALIQSEKVNLFDPRQLAIGAVILVVGIGGSMFPGGNLPLPIPGQSFSRWLAGHRHLGGAGHPAERGFPDLPVRASQSELVAALCASCAAAWAVWPIRCCSSLRQAESQAEASFSTLARSEASAQ